jgi:hypothetical protein
MATRYLAPFAAMIFLAVASCDRVKEKPTKDVPPSGGLEEPDATQKLVDARKGFRTKLVREVGEREPIDQPPPNLFKVVKYDSPAGKLSAYLSVPKKKGVKYPAIIWITGGDCNSIGEIWQPARPDNDQTAAAYWKSGIIAMYPSLRGGNDNPGKKEGFLGEVDDVLAAADYLAKQDFVDPKRIYLGGHSTGGTLVMLVAECSDRFRAVFSFGPVDNVAGYGPRYLPFDYTNSQEVKVRSPGYWLHCVGCPLFVFEGADGNIDSLNNMARKSKNPLAHFFPMNGGTHFSILSPLNKLIAGKILADTEGDKTKISFSKEELGR